MKNKDLSYDCLVYFRDLLLKTGYTFTLFDSLFICATDDIYSCFHSALIYLNNKCK